MREFDPKVRVALAQEIQKYDALKVFRPRATSASSFRISWPAQRNRLVWQVVPATGEQQPLPGRHLVGPGQGAAEEVAGHRARHAPA